MLKDCRSIESMLFSVVAFFAVVTAHAAPPDAGFYTGYSLDYPGYVTFITCGSSPTSEGCYGSGTFGPFSRVGCMIEGMATTSGHVVTRAVFVIDVASGSESTGVTLYRYSKTDTIDPTSGDDTVHSTLTNTVALPLVGSATAACYIAGTTDFLYIGTDQTGSVIRVQKGPLTTTSVVANQPGSRIKALTADQYGFVSIETATSAANSDQFSLYAPSGRYMGDGGGDYRLLTRFQSIAIASP